MLNRPGNLAAASAALIATFTLSGAATSKNFVPDYVFSGSALTGWTPLGGATWRAEKGEIVAAPGSGGWLFFDRSYQDVGFYASVRCAEGCKAGVLLRAEATPDGGVKGIYASLVEGDLATYRVTHRRQGRRDLARARAARRRRPGARGATASPAADDAAGRRAWRCGRGARRRRRLPAFADAGRHRGADRAAVHRSQEWRLEHRRAPPRRQHPARVPQRRRRPERRRRRRGLRPVRPRRPLRRRQR